MVPRNISLPSPTSAYRPRLPETSWKRPQAVSEVSPVPGTLPGREQRIKWRPRAT